MPQAPQPKDGQYLWLDPHILCTPALADIDGDGHEDLVVAATYFFDRDEYDSQVCSDPNMHQKMTNRQYDCRVPAYHLLCMGMLWRSSPTQPTLACPTDSSLLSEYKDSYQKGPGPSQASNVP